MSFQNFMRDMMQRNQGTAMNQISQENERKRLEDIAVNERLAGANQSTGPFNTDLDFDTRGVNSIEDLIRIVQPQAEDMIKGGAAQAEEQIDEGWFRSLIPLYGTAKKGIDALGQEADILGMNGPEAQEAALAAIEMTPMEKEQVRRETQQMRANQSAVGGVGGGNSIAQSLNLAGQQEGRTVNRKIGDLQTISSKGLDSLGQILRMTEEMGVKKAGLPMETSTSLANILTGTAAPIAGSRMGETERRGLNNLSVSQGQADRLGQLSGILGNVSTMPMFQNNTPAGGYGYGSYTPNSGASMSGTAGMGVA